MRRESTKFCVIATVLILGALAGRQVQANELDLSVARFIECTAGGADCIAHNDAYERFLSEYSFGIAPKLLAPASTLGYSGFYLGVEASVVTVPDNATAKFTGEMGEITMTPGGELALRNLTPSPRRCTIPPSTSARVCPGRSNWAVPSVISAIQN